MMLRCMNNTRKGQYYNFVKMDHIAEVYIADNHMATGKDALMVRLSDGTNHIVFIGTPEECSRAMYILVEEKMGGSVDLSISISRMSSNIID